jgi:hypothetical protein
MRRFQIPLIHSSREELDEPPTACMTSFRWKKLVRTMMHTAQEVSVEAKAINILIGQYSITSSSDHCFH